MEPVFRGKVYIYRDLVFIFLEWYVMRCCDCWKELIMLVINE